MDAPFDESNAACEFQIKPEAHILSNRFQNSRDYATRRKWIWGFQFKVIFRSKFPGADINRIIANFPS